MVYFRTKIVTILSHYPHTLPTNYMAQATTTTTGSRSLKHIKCRRNWTISSLRRHAVSWWSGQPHHALVTISDDVDDDPRKITTPSSDVIMNLIGTTERRWRRMKKEELQTRLSSQCNDTQKNISTAKFLPQSKEGRESDSPEIESIMSTSRPVSRLIINYEKCPGNCSAPEWCRKINRSVELFYATTRSTYTHLLPHIQWQLLLRPLS